MARLPGEQLLLGHRFHPTRCGSVILQRLFTIGKALAQAISQNENTTPTY